MVSRSTRGLKYKFIIGEKVLCYEPDPTKAIVLYDSKVLEIIESKDKRGKRIIEYLIHFQGWNSSWDRRVIEEFVLKDTDENRQLQKNLAEKSQLQIGTFLYRKDRKKRKHSGTSTDSKIQIRGSSEDNSSSSTFGRDEVDHADLNTVMEELTHIDSDSFSSSVESTAEEERVILKIGSRLRSYLDYDYDMINEKRKLLSLPSKISVLTILENFVKHYSIKTLCCPLQQQIAQKRRNSSAKVEKREIDYDSLKTNISLRQEVADGIRIYFDFTLQTHLLYAQEKEQANKFLSEEYLKDFKYIPSEPQTLDKLLFKQDPIFELNELQTNVSSSLSSVEVKDEENTRRRLRSSYKSEQNEYLCDIDLSAVKTSDDETIKMNIQNINKSPTNILNNCNSSLSTSNVNLLKTFFPLNISTTTKEMLQNILQWQILPIDTPNEASMIYGAIHLARLIVKLPDFLNASSIPDCKMTILLKYLDSFADYLESHSEWFGESHYEDANSNPLSISIPKDDNMHIKTEQLSPN